MDERRNKSDERRNKSDERRNKSDEQQLELVLPLPDTELTDEQRDKSDEQQLELVLPLPDTELTDEELTEEMVAEAVKCIRASLDKVMERIAAHTEEYGETKRRLQEIRADLAALEREAESGPPQKRLLPMVHGKASDSIAYMAAQRLELKYEDSRGIIQRDGVKFEILCSDDRVEKAIGISAHKLLSVAMYEFSQKNHIAKKGGLRDLKISIPLKEYALMCGYDVIEHKTETPEEAKKETLRAKRQLDNARRKINRDLDTLFRASLTWTEKVRGKERDYFDVRLIQSKGIKAGYIHMEFSSVLGEYLVCLPITQYPVELLGLDERNGSAYSMGLKMAEHYHMSANRIKKTAQLLRVKTLLNVTSLPKIEKLRSTRTGWESHIKEPFEIALDALTACGLLVDWEYCHSKGVSMTDEEATSLSYESWVESLVHFTLKDAPDHKEQQESKDEKDQLKRGGS